MVIYMAQVWEYIKIALMNIKSNKGRSFLTMLGIIIGISSVIMIISVGNGIKGGINDELSDMAGGQIALYANSGEDGLEIEFTDEDIQAIMEKVPNVKAVTPNWGFSGSIAGRKGDEYGNISFGMPGLEFSSNDPIIKGRYFNENDYYSANKVCVINESGAKKLFGNTNVIGMNVDINVYGTTQEFTIIGIRKDNASTSILGAMMGGSIAVEAPISVMTSSFGFYISLSNLLIISDGGEYSAQVAKDTVRLMENRHNVRGKNAIMVQNFNDVLGQMDQILSYVTVFVVLVAAISLLVGGIGVMNIMLVSVTERTREIGIRKALGARTGSILLQFLSESAIITLMGGVIGIILGVAGANGICSIVGFTAKVSASTVLGASLFSSGVGLFFGIYPAKKAAKLSPIEALRHE